jgi:uncharacterized Zn-binding protein involved in type VI secretion
MSNLDNLSLAVNQKLNGITGDRTSSSERVGNTWSSMFGTGEGDQHGALGNLIDSYRNANKAWNGIDAPIPTGNGDEARPPTEAEKKARTVSAINAYVGAVMKTISAPEDILNMGFANLTAPLAAIWPSMPAATFLSLYVGLPHAHAHPPSADPVPVPLPSLGPVLVGTCVQVLINYLPAARAGDFGLAPTCGGFFPFFEIKTGSSNVFIGGSRAARMGDICMACFPATSPRAWQKALHVGLEVAGLVAGGVGAATDIAEAEVEDDEAMHNAEILSAAMGAAQMASDIESMIVSTLLGKDPAITPSFGAIVLGHPNVLIGGFPMINILDMAGAIFRKLKRFIGKSKNPQNKGNGVGEEGFTRC